jgi:hypothetical protein
MNPANDKQSMAPPRRRWLRRLLWFGVPILAILFIPAWPLCRFAYDSQCAQRDLQDKLSDLDRKEPGWRLDDIEAAKSRIPNDENATPHVLAANRAMTEAKGDQWDLFDTAFHWELELIPPREPLSEKQRNELTRMLKDYELALPEARGVARFPRGRYSCEDGKKKCVRMIDGLKEHRYADSIAAVLFLDAVSLCENDKLEDSWRSGQALINVGRSFGEPETLGPLTTRLSIQFQALRTMERTLAWGEVQAEALAGTQQLLADEAAQQLLLFGLRGQRAAFNECFLNVETGALPVYYSPIRKMYPYFENLRNRRIDIPRYHLDYLDLVGQVIEATKLPARQEAETLAALEATEHGGIAERFLPAWQAAARRFHHNQAHLRCAVVALATERYRVRHGQWPDSLAALAPEFLAQVPTDPFNDQPLRYLKLADHVVIYSVGPDGIDNGGNLVERDRAPDGTDIGFRLWDPDQRRRPPKP